MAAEGLTLLLNATMTGLTLVIVTVAMTQAWIARDTAKRQLRAYVFYSAIDSMNVATGFKIIVRMKNFGMSPAQQVRTTVWTGAKDTPDRADDRAVSLPPQDLAPGGEFEQGFEVGCEAPYKADVLAGKRRLWLTGQVNYQDIYGQAREHHFCVGYDANAGKFGTHSSGNHST